MMYWWLFVDNSVDYVLFSFVLVLIILVCCICYAICVAFGFLCLFILIDCWFVYRLWLWFMVVGCFLLCLVCFSVWYLFTWVLVCLLDLYLLLFYFLVLFGSVVLFCAILVTVACFVVLFTGCLIALVWLECGILVWFCVGSAVGWFACLVCGVRIACVGCLCCWQRCLEFVLFVDGFVWFTVIWFVLYDFSVDTVFWLLIVNGIAYFCFWLRLVTFCIDGVVLLYSMLLVFWCLILSGCLHSLVDFVWIWNVIWFVMIKCLLLLL